MTSTNEQIRQTKERLSSKIDMTNLSQIPLPRKPLSEETKASMQRRYATAFTENPRIKLQLFEEKVAARGRGRRRRVIVGNPLQMKDQINDLFMKNKRFPVLEKNGSSENNAIDEFQRKNEENKEESKLDGKKNSVEFLESKGAMENNVKKLDTANNNQVDEKASKLDIRKVLPKWFKGSPKESSQQISNEKENEEKGSEGNDEKEYLMAHNMDGEKKGKRRPKLRRPQLSPNDSDDQSSSNNSPAINCDETLFDKFMRSVSRTSQACATGGYESLNRSGTHNPLSNMFPKYPRQEHRQRTNSDEMESLLGGEFSPPEDAILSRSDGYVRKEKKAGSNDRNGTLPFIDLHASNSSSDSSGDNFVGYKRSKSRFGTQAVEGSGSPTANSKYSPRGWETPPGRLSRNDNGSKEHLFSSYDEASFRAKKASPDNSRYPSRCRMSGSVSPNRGLQPDLQGLACPTLQRPPRLRPITTTGAAVLPEVRPQDLFALEKQMGGICTK